MNYTKERVIGTYTENRNGPLLIILAAVHGNEPAGVKALEFLFKMLEVEHITNPNFELTGTICGILGNREAYSRNERYIDRDLNRLWSSYLSTDCHESYEIRDIIDKVNELLKIYNPEHLVVLDIHTTSSGGGIFVIPGHSDDSLKISSQINAPVIKNMLQGISGTTMDHFNQKNFSVKTDSLTFESGQHSDPLSVNRAIAGIINCMKAINMINQEDVENIHNDILTNYSHHLPKVCSLVYKHHISPSDSFQMKPNYYNFQSITAGEHIADQNGSKVLSPANGRILMPLYQKLGSEGFFIIKEESEDLT